jgi:DNA topoisomerase VI subunit B
VFKYVIKAKELFFNIFAPRSIKGFESVLDGDMIHKEINKAINRINKQKEKYKDKVINVKEKKDRLDNIETSMNSRINNLDKVENKFKNIIEE